MKSILTQIITGMVLRQKNYPGGKNSSQIENDNKRKLQKARVTIKNLFADVLLILLGIFSAGFGLKGFLLPNHFVDGGTTGISLLLTAVTGIPLSILIIAVNTPFIIFGFKTLGKQFVIKTSLAIAGLA